MDSFTINSGATLTNNIDGAGGTDSLIQVDGANTWIITGADTGTVTDVGGTFSNMENLTGGSGVDTFTINSGASLTGNIDSGAAADSLIQADGTNAWDINAVGGGTVTDVGGTFANVENLTGGTGVDTFTFTNTGSITGALVGGGGTDTLVGDDDGNTFVVTGADAGTLAAKITGGWSQVENLIGAAGVDSFTINSGATLTNNIDGAGGTDSLIQVDGANTWIITGADTGTVTDVGGTFSNMENLTGGSGVDTFTINSGASLTGNIDSGAAADSLIQADGTNAWDINAVGGGTVTDVGGTFANVENLTGGTGVDTFTFTNTGSITGALVGGGGTDTLVGDDDGNTFVVTGADAGTLAAKITGGWSQVENLIGAAGVDTFVFNTAATTITGNVDGQAGSDTLDYSSLAGPITITLVSNGTVDGFAGTDLNTAGFDNIDVVIGTPNTQDIFRGMNADAVTSG